MNLKISNSLVLGLACVLLTSCSTTHTTDRLEGVGAEAAFFFPMTELEADKVMADAMSYQFPDGNISRIDLPFKGYTVTRRFMLDSQTFAVRRIPSSGSGLNGELVSGFYFEVIDEGTMPVSGATRASSLFQKVIELSNQISKPIVRRRLQ